ncbi:MAG: hypothetical protein IJ191_04570 [Treponema sp.]|nr:hypothetical protein [Treponema sp.]
MEAAEPAPERRRATSAPFRRNEGKRTAQARLFPPFAPKKSVLHDENSRQGSISVSKVQTEIGRNMLTIKETEKIIARDIAMTLKIKIADFESKFTDKKMSRNNAARWLDARLPPCPFTVCSTISRLSSLVHFIQKFVIISGSIKGVPATVFAVLFRLAFH